MAVSPVVFPLSPVSLSAVALLPAASAFAVDPTMASRGTTSEDPAAQTSAQTPSAPVAEEPAAASAAVVLDLSAAGSEIAARGVQSVPPDPQEDVSGQDTAPTTVPAPPLTTPLASIVDITMAGVAPEPLPTATPVQDFAAGASAQPASADRGAPAFEPGTPLPASTDLAAAVVAADLQFDPVTAPVPAAVQSAAGTSQQTTVVDDASANQQAAVDDIIGQRADAAQQIVERTEDDRLVAQQIAERTAAERGLSVLDDADQIAAYRAAIDLATATTTADRLSSERIAEDKAAAERVAEVRQAENRSDARIAEAAAADQLAADRIEEQDALDRITAERAEFARRQEADSIARSAVPDATTASVPAPADDAMVALQPAEQVQAAYTYASLLPAMTPTARFAGIF